MSDGIPCVGLTAAEADKVGRVATGIREWFPAIQVVGCHAVGTGAPRALCFTRADGRIVACVAADVFLAAADPEAVARFTAFYYH